MHWSIFAEVHQEFQILFRYKHIKLCTIFFIVKPETKKFKKELLGFFLYEKKMKKKQIRNFFTSPRIALSVNELL